jgi:hypothetical protein
MSTVIIAFIIVAFVMASFILLVYINRKHRLKALKELMAQFQREKEKNDLSISKWETAGQLLIGLDVERKVILACHRYLGQYRYCLVDLSKVKHCLTKKIYFVKISGNAENERYERQVEQISLQFEFIDEWPPVMIAFYHFSNNNLLEMAELEQKATEWADLVRVITHSNENARGERRGASVS